jgi:fungal STAND N-terminal Goodbye domain
MSSTVQETSSTFSTSSSNIQLITDALVDYAKVTGIDLSNNPFAAAIERANSPGTILELLQEREKAFKDYREENRRLINCLSPAVNVIQAFSGILGEAVSLVSHTSHLVTLITPLVRSPSHQQRRCSLGSTSSSPVVPSIFPLISSLVIYESSRPPVGSPQVMMPS